MGEGFGRREPFVELEVDGPGAGIDAELAPSTVVVLPAAMGVGEEVVDQFFDSAFERQTAFGRRTVTTSTPTRPGVGMG